MSEPVFELDPSYLHALAHSAEALGLCMDAAEGIAAIARATAPVDTGDYQRSISVEAATRSRRVAAEVVATDPATMIIEARTGNLARALRKYRG
ncbi:hypothetical protein ACQBAU_16310 [Propionibacteriaceae bacterium Y2011]